MRMVMASNFRVTLLQVIVMSVLVLTLGLVMSDFLQAHGGKTHGGQSFTALQALQKATELYDRLIVKGKLDESWETGLQQVAVTSRGTDGRKEYRVGFHRRAGKPEAVYIFFSAEGNYSGSNFDGRW